VYWLIAERCSVEKAPTDYVGLVGIDGPHGVR
jgi:hypothetical protein